MLDVDCLACDTCRIRSIGDRAKSFSGMFLYPCLVPSPRVLDHLRISR
jgi:hypothetical protein